MRIKPFLWGQTNPTPFFEQQIHAFINGREAFGRNSELAETEILFEKGSIELY